MTGTTLARWRTRFTDVGGNVLTQAQAAAWYGVHERTWRGYENGRYRRGRIPTALEWHIRTTTGFPVGNTMFILDRRSRA